jgi:flagellar hook-basal body complex protein FliE
MVIAPIASILSAMPATAVDPARMPIPQPAAAPASFQALLTKGISSAETKLAEADRLVARFAVDDSVPIHQVTYALEQARISFELVLQVRNRMMEGVQQLMNMPL